MQKRLGICFFVFCIGIGSSITPAYAQIIKGYVTNEEDIILPGALVWMAGREQYATTADKQGGFILNTEGIPPPWTIVAAYTAHKQDTFTLSQNQYLHIILYANATLETILIEGRRAGQYTSTLTPIRTEVISSQELKKAACCDLAGCFNTNATVQATATNIITNAKELRILGLSGVYNQVLWEGFPLFTGAAYTYGMNLIPGPTIENIYVAKGANSVLQGWEGLSGIINVETFNPDTGPSVFLNGYLNTFGERQYTGYATVTKGRSAHLTHLHMVQPAARTDRDGDGFLDLPLIRRYQALHRWHLSPGSNDPWSASAAIKYTNEDRLGGQTQFQRRDQGSREVYGQHIHIQQPEGWFAVNYEIDGRNKITMNGSGLYHRQGSWYGLLSYNVTQSLANSSLQYRHITASGDDVKMGVQYRYLRMDEHLAFTQNELSLPQQGRYLREDKVAGFFLERLSYFLQDKITWIAGIRADHHQVHGWMITPRTLIKYDPIAGTTLRVSGGSGWRMANVFSEQPYLLATNRPLSIDPNPGPEKGWNTGVSITQNISWRRFSGQLGIDYYHTRFDKQLFPNFQQYPMPVIVGMLDVPSRGNAFQIDWAMQHVTGWEFKVAYNFVDVFTAGSAGRETLPLNPKHRVLGVLTWAPNRRPWHADMHFWWYGRQALPSTAGNPEPYIRPTHSQPYATFTLQWTYKWDKWELYTGCENIFDFRQRRPILGWEEPFGPHFDTAFVWGPTRGREGYLGIRYAIHRSPSGDTE